ncbi:MAG: hemolysin III family protein [Propionibacteriaceae bacterium]|jgi:hemolysin III|nr:hemolysin III family protein [Propionibacteriaceae bacterium]
MVPAATQTPAPTDQPPKPRLRGWLHAAAAPLIVAASIVFLVLARGWEGKLAMAVYLATSLILFGNSATYHIGRWGPKVKAVLRRFDHSNIYLFIAGTYTPLATFLTTGLSRVVLLAVIWSAAGLGVLFRILWLGAPRWLYTCLYVLMGWAAVWWLPQFWASGGPAVVWLILAGGLVYSGGAVVYALKAPNPLPKWFGFHEIFHTCTVVAAACHFVAIALAVAHTW